MLQAIGAALPGDAVVVEELLSSAPGIRQLLKSNDARSFYGMRGGGIGWGLAAAVGIQLALPRRSVVALIGDGSSLYTMQVLWTAAHERIPVTFVIFNNRSYRILKQRTLNLQRHTAQSGRFVAMDLVEPALDFVGLAQSLGVSAQRGDDLDGVRAALAAPLASGVPNLIEVAIDNTV